VAGVESGSATWDYTRKPITEFNDPNWSDQISTSGEWTWDSNDVKSYVDQMLLNEVDLGKTIKRRRAGRLDSGGKSQCTGDKSVPSAALYHSQSRDRRHAGGDRSKTEFPAKFEVDYVRIYLKGIIT